MRNIFKLKFGVLWMLVMCLSFFSCTDDNDFEKEITKGLPVSMSFDITSPAPNEVETRATGDDTKIEKLKLYFYNADVADSDPDHCTPLSYEVTDLSNVSISSNTNYKYNISVPETVGLTSGRWYIYAIANWHKGFWDKDVDVTPMDHFTKTQMDRQCMIKNNHDINFTETSMLLTGKYGTNNAEGETKDVAVTLKRTTANNGVNKLSESIHLQRSLAQINFYFVNANENIEFIPTSYDLYNYSLSSTLIERRGWTGTANPGKLSGSQKDMDYEGTNGTVNFINKEGLKVYKNIASSPYYGFQFYMPENVQRVKNSEGLSNQAMREKRNKTADGKNGEFKYAPANATYVVVHGTYKGPANDKQGNVSEVTANVDYTIHLGDFSQSSPSKPNAKGSLDNFSVRRNTRYNFRITVAGVDNIITEAEATTEGREPQPGAEGDVINSSGAGLRKFDAHYETAIVAIPKAVAKATEFSVVLNTPKTGGLNRIATYQYDKENINGVGNALAIFEDIEWIKFCNPSNIDVYRAYPGSESKDLMNVKDLLKAFHEYKGKYSQKFITDSKNIYLQVFVDEYFYEDLAKLNKYSEFVNAKDRSLILAAGVKISQDGNSTYTKEPLFSFSQTSIKTMYDVSEGMFGDQAYNPFGLETVEDKTRKDDKGIEHIKMYLNEGSDKAGEGESFPGGSRNDGYNNNINLIGDGKIIGKEWADYVDIASNKMQPKYDFGLYHYLLRNRDLNGNGVIDDGEIRWYMPALNQHIAIWNGYHALPESALLNKAMHYFSSTNGVYRTLWAYEGAFGFYKPNHNTGDWAEHLEAVRCIRPLRYIKELTTPSTEFVNSGGRNIFKVSKFGPNAIRQSGIQVGDYPYHAQLSAANKLPEAFEVAKNYMPGTYTYEQIKNGGVCSTYSQESGGKDLGTWRMPNQRELMIILMMWNKYNDAGGFNFLKEMKQGTAAITYYDEQKNVENNRVYFVQKNHQLFVTSESRNSYYVLPVRDVKAAKVN